MRLLGKRARSVGGVIALAALLAVPGTASHPPSVHAASRTTQPNIVFILTDDQRWDSLWAMPFVQSELVAQGVTFANSFVVNSLCCPSRATSLTGEYSHATGVYTNMSPNGGFKAFSDGSTVATWLHDAGYHTGLIGKYLNQYRSKNARYIPPGWDRWFAIVQGRFDNESAYYYNYTVSDQGTSVAHGSTDADYSTDVFAAQADSFIREANPDQPLFLYWSPAAPHTPATSPARYVDAFSDLTAFRPPNYNEADVSDKPGYIKSLKKLASARQATIDAFRIHQYRTLLAVDDAVHTIVTALADTGRLSNTMIVFTSDNGLTYAEHRWATGKLVPYEESIRVPLVIRYDPITASTSREDADLVANIDLAPTFAEVAGVPAPGAEGMSVIPLLAQEPVTWRTDFLIEHLPAGDTVPSFCGVRNDRYTFVAYNSGDEELYDLTADPYELTNVYSDPEYAPTVASMQSRAMELCSPVPPGFIWPFGTRPPG